MIDNDAQLVEAIQQSDQEAFKVLFNKYYKPLIRFSWYRTFSMETSRDLVQEIFFKIWLNRNKLDPNKSIKAYLYKSLTNTIINFTRLNSTKTISLDSVEEGKLFNNQKDLDIKLDIQAAIELLPEKLKTVYILSRVEGYNYKEIAGICNITIKAVEKRMSKAFIQLRKSFSKNI